MTNLLTLLFLFSLVSLSLSSSPGWLNHTSMLIARSDTVVVTVGDNMYVLGGCDAPQTTSCISITASFTVYSFPTGTWSYLASAPRPRYRYMAAAVGNMLYYVGGRSLDNDTVISEVDVYDVTTGNWSTLPDQGGVTDTSDGCAFVIGSKLYVSGGYANDYTTLNETVVLDTTASWSQLVFKKGVVANKIVSSGDNGGVALGNYAYVFGGWGSLYDAPTNWCEPLPNVELYDSISNTWTLLPSLPYAIGDMAYAMVNTTLFVIGGESMVNCSPPVPVGRVFYYPTTTNTNGVWTDVAPIAISRFRFSAGVYGTEVYDVGGMGAGVNGTYPVLKDVYSLNVLQYLVVGQSPATVPSTATPNTTPTHTSTPTPTSTPSSASHSGFVGGYSLLVFYSSILMALVLSLEVLE